MQRKKFAGPSFVAGNALDLKTLAFIEHPYIHVYIGKVRKNQAHLVTNKVELQFCRV